MIEIPNKGSSGAEEKERKQKLETRPKAKRNQSN
jgi:hypothetical protein